MTAERKLPKSITQADFQLIADHCYQFAWRIVRGGHPVVPMVIAGTVDDGRLKTKLLTRVPLETGSDKGMLARLMETLVQHHELDFVALVCEVWTANLKTPDYPGSLADHPDRQEAVVVNIMSKDNQVVVINTLRRSPIRMKRGKIDFSIKMQGRMVRDPETKH
jgi:hypothetical protein